MADPAVHIVVAADGDLRSPESIESLLASPGLASFAFLAGRAFFSDAGSSR